MKTLLLQAKSQMRHHFHACLLHVLLLLVCCSLQAQPEGAFPEPDSIPPMDTVTMTLTPFQISKLNQFKQQSSDLKAEYQKNWKAIEKSLADFYSVIIDANHYPLDQIHSLDPKDSTIIIYLIKDP